jgi:hypothetical protein
MTAKFTKGPWVIDDYGNIIPENGKDARDCIRAGGLALTSNAGEPMYNRHLIACAPEMYEMLDSLLQNSSFNANFPEEFERIETLLAKARGEV